MSHNYLAMAMDQSLAATIDQRRIKADAIKDVLAGLPPNLIYAETNHMFIKTFSDVIMEVFPRELITVVILRRDLVKVLKSFANLAYFSEKNEAWPHWMHRVPCGISLTCPPIPYEQMDMYDRSISYLIDIEAQAQAFKQKYPDCTVHEVFLDELQDLASVLRFFEHMNLEATPKTGELVDVRINDRQAQKDVMKSETTEDYCRERIRNYLARCREQRVVIPALPQFKDVTAKETTIKSRPDRPGLLNRITQTIRKLLPVTNSSSSVHISHPESSPSISPPVQAEPESVMDTETVIITKPSFPSPSQGFFSMITQALSNLYDLRNRYSKFYFDYSENALYRDNRFGEENYFNNYFEQYKNLLASPKKQYIDWTIEWSLRRDAWQNISGPSRDEVSSILHQHIKIKETILTRIAAIKREKFEGKKILGLHKRGTDHHMHGELLDIDYYFSIVDQHLDQFDGLYLATDEEATLDSFKKRYQGKLICVEDFYRSSDSNCVHKHNFTNNYKKGEDVLIEAVLLSSVDLLLRTRSNITLFSILYNKDLPFQHIDTHIEYH